jgi:hypothetical protein
MWVVAKVKTKELSIFKKNLIEKLGKDTEFYHPKIEYHRYFGDKLKKIEKFVLENYIFCYHEKFKKSNFINKIRFLKGLEYFLNGYNQDQEEIIKFIECCQTFENKEGYLTQAFFNTMDIKKAKFISGPFTNMIFEILERQKNKLKILVGNIVTTVSDKKNYLYCSI